MDLKTRKTLFMEKVSTIEAPVFEQLEAFLDQVTRPKTTLKEYNKALEDANSRIDSGVFFTDEEVEKIANEWK